MGLMGFEVTADVCKRLSGILGRFPILVERRQPFEDDPLSFGIALLGTLGLHVLSWHGSGGGAIADMGAGGKFRAHRLRHEIGVEAITAYQQSAEHLRQP